MMSRLIIDYPSRKANTVVVIGDPNLEGFLPQLPGAYNEANSVADIFTEKLLFSVKIMLHENAFAIIPALFSSELKALHFAGYLASIGEDVLGLAIGKHVFLTNAEIAQLSYPPEFVFIHCIVPKNYLENEIIPCNPKDIAVFGEQLIELGVQAVLIVQADFEDSVPHWEKSFYEALFSGHTIDWAIQNTTYLKARDTENNVTFYGNANYRLVNNNPAVIKIKRPAGEAAIELLQGNILNIPEYHAVDMVVTAVFKNSLLTAGDAPALRSIWAVLNEFVMYEKLNSVNALGCWLSMQLNARQEKQYNFKKILSVEWPKEIDSDELKGRHIFRCINAFAFDNTINTVAISVSDVAGAFPFLLEAAIFWLDAGIPLKTVKLIAADDDQVEHVRNQFLNSKLMYEQRHKEIKPSDPDSMPANDPDSNTPFANNKNRDAEPPGQNNNKHLSASNIFISYAHVHGKEIDTFVIHLKKGKNSLNIFYDKESIQAGGLWLKALSDAIKKADVVMVFLSPDYENSLICWDEFQMAKVIEYNTGRTLIKTAYLYSYKNQQMAPVFAIHSWFDCREGSTTKLQELAQAILMQHDL